MSDIFDRPPNLTHVLGIIVIAVLIVVLFASLITPNRKPTVVVNMPADAKPLATLTALPDTKVITSERAVLWWTVYKETLERTELCDTSVRAADQALVAVYGK
jgi:hypothetical protein